MKPAHLIASAAALALLGVAGGVIAQNAAPAAGPAGAPAAGAAAAGAPGGAGARAGGAPGGGGGGGRAPNPQAVLYTDSCAGCHGAPSLTAYRAPSLFTPAFLSSHTNAQIEDTIKNGRPGTEMVGFKGQLTDLQISQLTDYLRITGATLKPAVAFIPDPSGQIITSQKQKFRIDVVAKGLMTPWGETFLPDGRMLVTERDGRLRIIDKSGKLLPDPVKGTPVPHVQQDGGYLDVVYNDGWIYLAYTGEDPNAPAPPPPAAAANPAAGGRAPAPPQKPSLTVFIRGKLNAQNEWTQQQVIWKGAPDLYTTQGAHYGTRFLFDGKGHLFFSIGERGDQTNAQKLTVPLGKIHRINVDGTIPKDNPFVDTPGAVPSIWTYGHRNPEGLAFNPADGVLWESEHGPTNGDEINVIQKGHNYGWGVASMGTQPGITLRHQDGMDDPITYYTPTIAPSGINFYNGTKYPGWKGSLFVAALAGQQLRRLEVKGNTIVSQEVVFEQFGRVREAITGPDGLLYVLLQNPTGGSSGVALSASTPGQVVKLTPVK